MFRGQPRLRLSAAVLLNTEDIYHFNDATTMVGAQIWFRESGAYYSVLLTTLDFYSSYGKRLRHLLDQTNNSFRGSL